MSGRRWLAVGLLLAALAAPVSSQAAPEAGWVFRLGGMRYSHTLDSPGLEGDLGVDFFVGVVGFGFQAEATGDRTLRA